MAGTLTAGILVGSVFVVPGLGTVAIAGLLEVPLGTMLIYGTLIGPPTAVLTTFIYSRVLRYGLWNTAKDEAHFEDMPEESLAASEEAREEGPAIGTRKATLPYLRTRSKERLTQRKNNRQRNIPLLYTSRSCPS